MPAAAEDAPCVQEAKRTRTLDRSKPVCVTGASGFIASFVVRDLLARGWRVHGTVRNLKDPRKVEPLQQLPGADSRLRLFQADLLGEPADLRAALQGCGACMHTATPIEIPADGSLKFTTLEDLEKHQVTPAVQGSDMVFKACAEAGVNTVVLTSSTAAMLAARPPGYAVMDETCWSDEEFMREALLSSSMMPYRLAKTLQERRAWELAKEYGMRLCTICPALVVGPHLTPTLNFSHEVLLRALTKGVLAPSGLTKEPGTLRNTIVGWVDVREVALAHVLAMEKPEAEGRYLCVTAYPHLHEVLKEAHAKFPGLAARGELYPLDVPVEGSSGEDFKLAAGPLKWSNAKVRALGVEAVPWQQSLVDSIKALQGLGALPADASAQQ